MRLIYVNRTIALTLCTSVCDIFFVLSCDKIYSSFIFGFYLFFFFDQVSFHRAVQVILLQEKSSATPQTFTLTSPSTASQNNDLGISNITEQRSQHRQRHRTRISASQYKHLGVTSVTVQASGCYQRHRTKISASARLEVPVTDNPRTQ